MVALVIIARSILPLFTLIAHFPLNDFSVYLDGTRATLAGKNPYDLWFFDRYNYAPAATILFVPFTWVSQNAAEFIITTISLLSAWITLTIILASMEVKLAWQTKVLLYGLILKIFPVKLTLALGQINLVILALVIASFYFQYKKPYLAGSLLSIASAIKLTPVPLILYFIIKKNTRVFISFFITLTALTILGAYFFDFPLSHYYYSHVVPELNSHTSRATLNATYMNQSVTALLGRWGIFGFTNSLVRYIFSGVFISWIGYRLAKTNSRMTDFILFSLLLIATTIFLPIFVWQHHYVVIIPLLCAVAVNHRWIALCFYLFFIWYFKNSGQAVVASPLVASHFLTVTIILVTVSLLYVLPAHSLGKK